MEYIRFVNIKCKQRLSQIVAFLEYLNCTVLIKSLEISTAIERRKGGNSDEKIKLSEQDVIYPLCVQGVCRTQLCYVEWVYVLMYERTCHKNI